jgi:hypothetical protein
MSSDGGVSPDAALKFDHTASDLLVQKPLTLQNTDFVVQEGKSVTKKPFLKRGSRMPISKIPSDPFAPVVQPIKNPPKSQRASSLNHSDTVADRSFDEEAISRERVIKPKPPIQRPVSRQPPRVANDQSWEQVAEKQSEELESFLKDMSSMKHMSDSSSLVGESPRMGSLMKKVFSGGSPRIESAPERPSRRQRGPVPPTSAPKDSADSLIYGSSRSARVPLPTSSSYSNSDDVTVRERIHQLDLQIDKFRKENEYCKKLRLERETALAEANRYKERALRELEEAEKEIEEEKTQLAAEKRRFLQEKDRGRSMVSQLRELTDENKMLRDKLAELESDSSQKQKKMKNEISRLNSMLSDASRTKYELELEVKALSASQMITASKPPALSPVSKSSSSDEIVREDFSGQSVSEMKHADGRIDRTYHDGRREAVFPSGLRKIVFPGGSAVVHFPNGDVKETSCDNIVTYQYHSTGCVQTTYPDGLEVLKFASGQIEKHFSDGTKEITFPNKLVKRIARDGTELSGTYN